ncbi:hypothetical protein N9B94_03380 [Verrucomicrobia bacterium]|nr:hypothetical protein [Verrucomicrobiota bacterium]
MAPPMEMSQQSVTEYTEKMRGRYRRRTGKRARSKLLDEYVEVTDYERKYANKVLRNQRRVTRSGTKRGAPVRYGKDLQMVLRDCWLVMEQPCGKRMADMLPLWVNHIEELEEGIHEKLLEISPATIDRLLKGIKTSSGRRWIPWPIVVGTWGEALFGH